MNKTIPPFSFYYTRSRKKIVLEHALTLSDQKIIWLVGNSGCGKSTFLHLLKGFYPEFLQGDLSNDSINILENAAYIAQNPLSQILHERVGEEFFFSMENAHYSHEQMRAKKSWLKEFGLEEKEFEKTSHLSHGQAQRLLLASMLATKPEWIILDEPTAFLDDSIRHSFYTTLHSFKKKMGIIIIDHNLSMAKIADTCLHINDEGLITEISVQDWLLLQEKEILQSSSFGSNLIAPAHTTELSAKNLLIGYPSKILFRATFTIQSRECAVLLGDNGSGKSTFFNTLASIQKPLQGKLDFKVNEKPASIQNHLAYIFQHPDSHFFFDTLSDELKQLGLNEPDSVLNEMNLQNRNHHSPHQLSEGQKRRLTLFFPVLQKRSLILMDEPTFGQDHVQTQKIIQLIQELKSAGYALIVITHDINVQKEIATHIWRIKKGELEHVS